MAIVNNTGGSKKFQKGKDDIIYGRVVDIILDINHPQFQNYDDIGVIFFQESNLQLHKRKMPTSKISLDLLPSAKPLHPNSRYLPLKNEIVALYYGIGKGEGGQVYFSSVMNIWNHPHHNALPTRGELANIISQGNEDYDNNNGTPLRKSEDGDTGINLGTYYSESLAIKPLMPYEGDFLLEGRFGNSIRFGSTNNSEKLTFKNHWSNGDSKTGDPITIIRNGQRGIRVPINEQDEITGWEPTQEDPNGDDSSIYMTSNQVITDFKAAGLTDSEEPWISSWPSFGSEDIKEVSNQIPLEASQDIDTTEDMTDEELNQAAAGEDEITQSPADVDNPEEDDIRYFDILPDTDEEAENAKLKQFCDYLFGSECYLPILAGDKQIYEIFENIRGGSKYYYPEDKNNATHYITKDKLYEILVYYDVKISHKANSLMKLSKEPMKIGWLNSPQYFRAHYSPKDNTLHIPTVESIKFIFKKEAGTLGGPGEQNDAQLMETSRIMALGNVWSELSHACDIDKNPFFGYTKDDWKDLPRGIADLFGKRIKGKTTPEGRLIPKNSLYLKEDMRGINIHVDEKTTTNGITCIIEIKDIPGNFGTEKIEVDFKSDIPRKTINKRLAEIASDLLRVDHEINLRLVYQDISIISQSNYDDLIHHNGGTHGITEPQLAGEWLSDHDGRTECQQTRVIHVEAMTIEEVEVAYEKEVKTQGETKDSKPPVKYQNTQTGVFSFRMDEWPEVEAVRDNTNVGSGIGF